MRKNTTSFATNLSRLSPLVRKQAHLSFPPNRYVRFTSTHQPLNTSPPISDLSHRKEPTTFAAALTLAFTIKSPFLGYQIHTQIIKTGFLVDTFSQNNLVVMYSKCGLLADAIKVFEGMRNRNVVSWTSMISGCVHLNECEMGLSLFLEMMRSGFCPNEFALACVLSACGAIEAIRLGHLVHSLALKIGLAENLFVGSSLLWMYANFGGIEAAEKVFEYAEHPDLAFWNAMVEGYAINGYGYDAMKIVSLMHQKGLILDQFSYISALKACSIYGELAFGHQIHSMVVYHGFDLSTTVMNSLTDMYFKAGQMDFALKVFTRIQSKDNVSWNTVISGFAQEEEEKEAIDLFSKMLATDLKPNKITFSVLFRLCGAVGNLCLGLQFLCLAYHLRLHDETLIVNSLINMFTRCGLVGSACFLFNALPSRSTIAWNEMIAGCILNGYHIEAIQYFCSLLESEIEADEFTYSTILGACHGIQHQITGEQIHANIIKSGFHSGSVYSTLVNIYANFGLVDCSFKIFQEIGELDLVSWGTMISAFAKQGFSSEAFWLLNSLREAGEKPDEFVLCTALNACASIAVLNQCKSFHSHVLKSGYERHLCVASAVVDAYAKCGDINSSIQAFDKVSRNDDAVLYNTIITACANHGLIKDVVELFGRMKRYKICPNSATFVAVISACSHLGLIEQGQRFFDSISSDYGICPSKDNFACLVDLYSRNGLLDKAKDIIEDMPFEPWPAIWRSLLSGSRIHGKTEMGELAAERILQLVPTNDGAYVLLSNVYAEHGRWAEAEKIRMKMAEKGVLKGPGYSTVEISV